MTFKLLRIALLLASIMATAMPVQAQKIVVCIDPGHPSEVGRGTSGKHISEMAAAWIIANRVGDLLSNRGVNVIMTKAHEEQFVTNRERAQIANDGHAQLMVRLHCDGGNGIGSGFAVYYPDRQGRAVGGTVGPSAAVIAASRNAATVFYQTMANDLKGKLPARGLHPDTATRIGGKQGALTGSIFAKEPVVLVEMCVLTNAKDEAFIRSEMGQAAMAAALAEATMKAIEAEPLAGG